MGFGKKLIARAEEIVREQYMTEWNMIQRIAVIAGVGVREYYRKLGYSLEDEYMVKYLGESNFYQEYTWSKKWTEDLLLFQKITKNS